MEVLIDNELKVGYAKENVVMFNCDCRKLLEKVKSESIDCFCSDIPYKLSHKGVPSKNPKTKQTGGIFNCVNNTKENIDNIKKGKIFAHNDIKIEEYIGEVYRVLRDTSHCYLFSNWSNLNNIINKCEEVGLQLQNILCWRKR